MSSQSNNSVAIQYSIDHCLCFQHPDKETNILYLSGWCFDRRFGDSVTIDVFEGEIGIGSFSPDLDRHDVCDQNESAPLRCGFQVYLPMNHSSGDGGHVTLAFKNGQETLLNVRQKVTDIQDYFGEKIHGLRISEIRKSKVTNLLLNETERIHHVKAIKSSPIYLMINPSWECNLECPYCHAHIKRKHGYSLKMMGSNTFQKIMELFGEKLIWAHLMNRGEPFLNEHTMDYIETLKEYEVYVTISSHFNIQGSDEDADRLVLSGINGITACIDGATQETYVKYRQGGSLALALDNVQRIIKKKQEHGMETPKIRWRYLVFEWNEEEVEKARKLSSDMGFDEFDVKRGDVFKSYAPVLEIRDYSFMDSMKPEIRDLMAQYCKERTEKNHYYGCDNLYHQITINADGSIHPCRHAHEINHLFGSIHSKRDIFNSALYTNARRLFLKPPPEECQGYNPCLNCWIVTDKNYKGYVPSRFDFFSAYECITGQRLVV